MCYSYGDEKHGKGFTSRKRIFFIALDSKARLVLPSEIREALKIEKKGQILLSVIATSNNTVTVRLAKATISDSENSIAFSKNGRYIRKSEVKL